MRYCSPPVRITQSWQGKPSEIKKFGLLQATQPQSFCCQHWEGQTWYLWGAGGCLEQPGQNHCHLHLPKRCQLQSAVTDDQAGVDAATQSGTRFIPDPQLLEQDAALGGTRGFSIAENTQCFKGGRALAFGAGALPVTQRWASDLL